MNYKLCDLDDVTFEIKEYDYGHCVGVSAQGFKDGERYRFLMGPISKKSVPELAKVLTESVAKRETKCPTNK